jgi:hypothetical protein
MNSKFKEISLILITTWGAVIKTLTTWGTKNEKFLNTWFRICGHKPCRNREFSAPMWLKPFYLRPIEQSQSWTKGQNV